MPQCLIANKEVNPVFSWQTTRSKAAETPRSSHVNVGLKITGDIEVSSEVRIDGHISGNIRTAPDSRAIITIGPLGHVEGCLHGVDITISGTVVGSVVSTGCLRLNEGAHILGNIRYAWLVINPGAIVDGLLIVGNREDAGTPFTPLPAEVAA